MKNQISFEELHRMVTSGEVDLPPQFLDRMRATLRQVSQIAQAINTFLGNYQEKSGPATSAVLAQALIQVAAAHLMIGEGMDADNFGQFARTIGRIVEPTASKAHEKLSVDGARYVRHCACADCYARRHPDKRTLEPEERGRSDEDRCCFCGGLTRDGIYERARIDEAPHCMRRVPSRVGSAS